MSADRLGCPNCGSPITRPADFARKKIRCPDCGYYAETPASWWAAADPEPDAAPARDTAPPLPFSAPRRAKVVAPANAPVRRRADPRDTRPDFTPDAPAGVPLLAGTDDEDDANPYTVPGTGTKPCPHCRQQLPLAATLCVFCGRDLVTGEVQDRVHQPMSGTWVEGFSVQTRYTVMACLQGLNLALSTFFLATGGKPTAGAVFEQMLGQVVNIAVQAMLVGTYETLTVRRNAKGQTTIAKVRRLGFYPLPAVKLKWKISPHVGVVARHDPGAFAWIACLYSLGLGILPVGYAASIGAPVLLWFPLLIIGAIPAALFFWYFIRPAQFCATAADEYGDTGLTLMKSPDRERAEEVALFVAEATGLHYKPVM